MSGIAYRHAKNTNVGCQGDLGLASPFNDLEWIGGRHTSVLLLSQVPDDDRSNGELRVLGSDDLTNGKTVNGLTRGEALGMGVILPLTTM